MDADSEREFTAFVHARSWVLLRTARLLTTDRHHAEDLFAIGADETRRQMEADDLSATEVAELYGSKEQAADPDPPLETYRAPFGCDQ